MIRRNIFSCLVAGIFVCVSLFSLTACDIANNQLKHSRAHHKEFQDFRNALAPRIENTDDSKTDAAERDESIPALQSYVANASEELSGMPLVSISVNQTVPLRDVLFELSEQADFDIELDPRISGSIIFTARNKPFDVVIDRISAAAGLRSSFEGKTLRVELDKAYNKTYKIDYLNFVRSNSGSIRNDVSVVSGGGADTGSQYQASSSSDSDFWGELSTNLSQILGASTGDLRTSKDPKITAAPTVPAPVESVAAQTEDGQIVVQSPEAVLQVQSLPTDVEGESQSSSGQGSAGSGGASFAVNKQAGIITVFATDRQHKEVKEYLREIKRSVTAQVLIEAKVFEVTLSDEFSVGTAWSVVDLLSGELGAVFNVAGDALETVNPVFQTVPNPAAEFSTAYLGNDFQMAIEAISRLGTVQSLASPRMTVLNNQSAVLNVANNRVFFSIDIDVTRDENGDTQTEIDSQIQNVPEGVLINVLPSIDLDNRQISMSVRPTVTRIIDFVEDPAVQFVTASEGIEGVSNRVPVVNVQEMDSVLRVNSGQAIVMGGLMQNRSDNNEVGVPILSEVPVLGHLFKTHADEISKSELVVFLRATIVDSEGDTIHDMDRDLYNGFSGDTRPLKL